MAGGRVRLAARPRPSLAGPSRWQVLVVRREEEVNQPPKVLAGKGMVGRGEEVAGRPPDVLVDEGGGQPAEEECRPPA